MTSKRTEKKRPTTTEEIAAVLRLLSTAGYRTPEFTPEFVAIWTKTLRYLEPTVLRQAAESWVANQDRFPTLHGFREHAIGIGSRMFNDSPMLTEVTGEGLVPTPRAEYPARIAEIRQQMAECSGPLFKGQKVV